MPDTEQAPASTKPSMPAGQKAFLRVSGVIAMALFLLPTFYVIKYYALDRRREATLVAAERAAVVKSSFTLPSSPTADDLPVLADYVRRATSTTDRVNAVRAMGGLLQNTSLSFQRPMECVQAKSALADVAAHDADRAVRMAAQDEIGKIAQGGVVLRR